MHTTVDSFMFVDAFRRMDRENNFSRPALFALFDYLEEYEQETGEEIELYVIALCCEFTEYENAITAAEDIPFDAAAMLGEDGFHSLMDSLAAIQKP